LYFIVMRFFVILCCVLLCCAVFSFMCEIVLGFAFHFFDVVLRYEYTVIGFQEPRFYF
jgi:hypothetical protein